MSIESELDDRFRETCHMGGIHCRFKLLSMRWEGFCDEGFSDMAAWRRAIELSLGETDLEKLRMIARSRTEPASRVERARILLGYWENSSFSRWPSARAAPSDGPALRRAGGGRRPDGRIGRSLSSGRSLRSRWEAKAWLTSLSCRKAKDLGYPHELWTTRLLARHAREQSRRRAPVPGELGAGHIVQDPRFRGSEAGTRSVTTWRSVILNLRKKWPRCCASIAK